MNCTLNVLNDCYGKAEQRKKLMENPNVHGIREHKLYGKGKAALLTQMNSFYESNYNALPEENKSSTIKKFYMPDMEELETRYSHTYNLISTFVKVQILPSVPNITSWKAGINDKSMRKLYSVMVEDHVERQLGHKKGLNMEKETLGLPLFSAVNHSAVTYLLSTIITSVTRGKENKIFAQGPAIGGVS